MASSKLVTTDQHAQGVNKVPSVTAARTTALRTVALGPPTPLLDPVEHPIGDSTIVAWHFQLKVADARHDDGLEGARLSSIDHLGERLRRSELVSVPRDEQLWLWRAEEGTKVAAKGDARQPAEGVAHASNAEDVLAAREGGAGLRRASR